MGIIKRKQRVNLVFECPFCGWQIPLSLKHTQNECLCSKWYLKTVDGGYRIYSERMNKDE